MAVDDAHEWFSVEVNDETYMFDLTFLSSSWTCIYGRGCPGIGPEPAEALAQGCCSHGAHLLDKADRKKVRKFAGELTDAQWQLKSVAEELGDPIHRNKENDWVTRTHDGACIFLNRPDFVEGPGCALHLMALQTGKRPLDVKPAVCWQVPLRLDFHHSDAGHLTYMLTEWKRRDWGAGGEDFNWWCTESPEAFGDGHGPPVWRTLAEEIIELVGQEPYDALAEHLATRESASTESVPVTLLPHPALRRHADA